MDMYVVGGLIGRAMCVYVVVWMIIFIATKFSLSASIRKAHSWKSMVAMSTIFIVTLAAQVDVYI